MVPMVQSVVIVLLLLVITVEGFSLLTKPTQINYCETWHGRRRNPINYHPCPPLSRRLPKLDWNFLAVPTRSDSFSNNSNASATPTTTIATNTTTTTSSITEPNQKPINQSQQAIHVVVKRYFPNVTPETAKRAWLHYVWEQGGGLPVCVWHPNAQTRVWKQQEMHELLESSSNAAAVASSSSSSSSTTSSTVQQSKIKFAKVPDRVTYHLERVLLPIMMQEAIIVSDQTQLDSKEMNKTANNSMEESMEYKVSSQGLFAFFGIVEDSHYGRVDFVPTLPNATEVDQATDMNDAGTTMTWSIQFDIVHYYQLWRFITQRLVSTASDNLKSYLQPSPQLTMRYTADLMGITPDQALDLWVTYVWKQGGGLPIPPPIVIAVNDDNDNKDGTKLWKRLIVPPFLMERMVSIQRHKKCNTTVLDGTDMKNEIQYTVDNPSIWTTYPVHCHLGTVQFFSMSNSDNQNEANSDNITTMYQSRRNDNTKMRWTVEVDPVPGFFTFINFATTVIVGTLTKKFESHVREKK